MVQRSHAAKKDVRIMLSKEGCVLGMEGRGYAAKKDVQIKSLREECV